MKNLGRLLQREVENQLLNDLIPYGIDPTGLVIDWSNACQEGHCTQVLDGFLEDHSSVAVMDTSGNSVAEGWMDFIHGGGDNPLFVFWLFLDHFSHNEWVKKKDKPTIPVHIWTRLPETSKRLCSKDGEFDSRWKDDPLVVLWFQKINGESLA